MAASAWTFYNSARLNIGNGSINLATSAFKMALYKDTSNAQSVASLTVIGDVTNEVANQFGYTTAGQTMTTTWAAGANPTEIKFSCSDVIWTASGGNIVDVLFAVIYVSDALAANRKLLCYSKLSQTKFTVNAGLQLPIAPNAYGIFELG